MKRTIILATIALGLIAALTSAVPPTLAGPNCAVDATIDDEEQEFLRLINEHRWDNGLEPLALSDTLTRAAAWKSQDMADSDYFAHDDTGTDRSFVDRLRDCGYSANTWLGENIAAGYETAAATFEQWRDSPSHNANMLNSNFTAIGIGRAFDDDSEYGWYWTTDFGGEADGYTPPPASRPDSSGDVNCSGVIDSVDAALVLQFSARLIGPLPCQNEGDMNGDGGLDALDATLILQLAAGLFAGSPG